MPGITAWGEVSGHSGQAQLSPCPQAIMMSICLQSMVDELMVKKSGGSIRKVRGQPCTAAQLASSLCSHV